MASGWIILTKVVLSPRQGAEVKRRIVDQDKGPSNLLKRTFEECAHAAGIGVWFNLDSKHIIDPRSNTTEEWRQFVSNVALVKGHPALIGYYVSRLLSCRCCLLSA